MLQVVETLLTVYNEYTLSIETKLIIVLFKLAQLVKYVPVLI